MEKKGRKKNWEWREPEGRDWKAPPLAREEESDEARRRRWREKRRLFIFKNIDEDDDVVGFRVR